VAGVTEDEYSDAVSERAASLATDCRSAAELYFVLRAGAGDYTRNDADQRTRLSHEGLKACTYGAPRDACCEQARLLRDRIGGRNLVGLCGTFFQALGEDGCVSVLAEK
jgi:hypothetical protein